MQHSIEWGIDFRVWTVTRQVTKVLITPVVSFLPAVRMIWRKSAMSSWALFLLLGKREKPQFLDIERNCIIRLHMYQWTRSFPVFSASLVDWINYCKSSPKRISEGGVFLHRSCEWYTPVWSQLSWPYRGCDRRSASPLWQLGDHPLLEQQMGRAVTIITRSDLAVKSPEMTL